ncbi:MAG: ArnT family glycosyltransferase [Terriglobales bacterium]
MKTARDATSRLLFDLLVLAGCCAFLFFFGLNAIGLTGADEPRYAQIAREMLARGDWVTPVLHGQPWLEKPVLYYWEAMVSYSIFGVSDWAARLPAAVDATALVFAVYLFARYLWHGVELAAALITASCAFIVGFGHAASTDMPLSAAFAIGMLFWMAFEHDSRNDDRSSPRQKLWLAGFYLFTALGMLAKGPVAPLLAALIIMVLALLRRESRLIWRTLWVPGIVLFLGVALPWYVLVELRTGTFFRVFLLEHNLARYTTTVHRHVQPFWFFVPIVLAALLPWALLALAGLVRALRRWRESPSAQVLVVWAVLPVVFFSFSDSKLPGYILPVVPAFALLAVTYLYANVLAGRRMDHFLLFGHALLSGATLAAVLLAPNLTSRVRPPQQAITLATSAGVITFAAIMLVVRRAGWRSVRLITLAPVILGVAFLLRFAAPTLDATFSARPVARELARLQPAKGPVAIFNAPREVEYGLGFYLNQPIPRYDRDAIPAAAHVLITRSAPSEIAALVPGRQIVPLGHFPRQRLHFYWISAVK